MDDVLACPAVPPTPPPAAERPRYELSLDVHSDLKRVDGAETVRFTADRPTRRLVFRLWPNGPRQLRQGIRLQVGKVAADGRRTLHVDQPDPTTLVVRTTLAPRQTITVRLRWTLSVPRAPLDRIGRWRDGLRLGSFFPILAWDPRRGWATDPPTSILAETSTTPTAEYDVQVDVPSGMQALVSGSPIGPGRWRAHAVRDVGVAVGRFRIITATAHAPNPVTVRVGVSDNAESAKQILKLAFRALQTFARKYGAYRWATYTVVDSPDLVETGIEYPTLVFIGRGGPYLLPIVVHETAHQWFYSLVGNDQARDPWLDEALATWSEKVLDRELRNAIIGAPPGIPRHVGAPVSSFAGDEQGYLRQVYTGGVVALASLGTRKRVDCALRLYVARNAYRIAHPGDLIAALSRVFPGAARRLRRYGIHG